MSEKKVSRRRPFTQEELDAIRWRYENKPSQTVAEIAEAYDTSRLYIQQLAKDNHWRPRRKNNLRAKRALAAEMPARELDRKLRSEARVMKGAAEAIKGAVTVVEDWSPPADMPMEQIAMIKDPASIEALLDYMSKGLGLQQAMDLIGLWHPECLNGLNALVSDWEGKVRQALAKVEYKALQTVHHCLDEGDLKAAQFALQHYQGIKDRYTGGGNQAGGRGLNITFNLRTQDREDQADNTTVIDN